MKCVTPLGLYTITARPRPPRLARARCTPFRRLGRLQTARLWCRWPTTIEPPLQAVAVEQVGHNDAQCTSCGMAILLCKTSDRGGEGVRPGYTTATATHSPPQIFFRQLAPFAVDATRRHATFPYVLQDILACVSLLHRGAHWPH
jgi:hypothetical protein